MHKIKKRYLILVVILVMLLTPFVVVLKPYKIKNPDNPLFVESWFRLSDYYFQRDALVDALAILIPPGTPMARVDQILVEYGGAEKIDNTNSSRGFYGYSHPMEPIPFTPDAWHIDVYYNDEEKVEAVMFNRYLVTGFWDKEQRKKEYFEMIKNTNNQSN